MYTILFIDEEQDALDRFRGYVDAVSSGVSINLQVIFPLETLDKMIKKINEIKPDAIVSDFMLNEKKMDISYNVPYNGVDLVERYTELRELFPCFILTSFDMDAMNGSEDVNLVYIKGVMTEDEQNFSCKHGTFLKKILLQIDHYRTKALSDQNRLQELVALKKTGRATLKDEEELIKIDSRLENRLDSRVAIPNELKTVANAKQLEKLLEQADKLLDKINDLSKS